MIDPVAVSLPSGPWVHHANTRDLEPILERARTADVLLVQLDGAKMASVNALFREYAREFAFPEYFGHNWAAFDECMKNLEGRPAGAYVTIITDSGQLLSAEPDDLPTLHRQLEDIGRHWSRAFALGPEWGGGEVPFHTILASGRG